jgi:hypothetical protein
MGVRSLPGGLLVRRRLLAVLSLAPLVLGALAPALAVAQSPAPAAGATLALEPIGTSTVTGLAVLTPRDADTAANLLTVGAPSGAIAVIHAGGCASIDPVPVGLLGDVGTTGQLAATVPVSFATIADGAHVLVIHPGLDLATALACGAIPRTDAPLASVAPSAATSSVLPTLAPTSAPTADAACDGMDTWVAATLARFDAVKQMSDDLTTTMNAGMAAYAQALAANALAAQRLQIDQQGYAVPASARDAQAVVIRMLQKVAEAYDLMAQAYTSGNTSVLQQGLAAASEAQGLATAARTAIRSVATPCGITVPAV